MKWLSLDEKLGTAVAAVGPYLLSIHRRDNGEWQWTIARQPAGLPQQIVAYGVSASRDAAAHASETKLETIRRRGRVPNASRAMSTTERTRQHAAKLAAKAFVASDMRSRLSELSNAMASAGLSEWAAEVTKISRAASLRAVAEYTRRNAKYFVSDGPAIPSVTERAEREQRIGSIAAQIDRLAEAAEQDQATYTDFELLLDQLHKDGIWPEISLVSDVAHAFVSDHLR